MSEKYLAGDFPEGTTLDAGFGNPYLRIDKNLRVELVDTVVSVETLSQQNHQSILDGVAWGTIGRMVFGQAGMLAGVLAGTNREEFCVVCRLKDGRSFLASVDGSTLQKLLTFAYVNSAPPRPVEEKKEEESPFPAEWFTPPSPPPPPVANIFLDIDGKESGPFTSDQVYQKLANDELPSTTLFWKEGMTEWQSVGEGV